MSIIRPIAVGAAGLALTLTFFLGGCAANDSGQTSSQADTTRTQARETARNLTPGAEKDNPDTVRDESLNTATDATTESYAEVANYDYSEKDVAPLSVPEMSSKIGSVKDHLQGMRSGAKNERETRAVELLEQRADMVARQVDTAGPATSDKDRLELTRDLMEVQDEVANLDHNLKTRW